MQEQETPNGSSYTLTLTLEFESVVDLAQELREAKAALLDWKRARKAKCGAVHFEAVGPAKVHDEARKLLVKLHKDKAEPGPFLQGLEVAVTLINEKGKTLKELVLGEKVVEKASAPAPAAPAPAAPAPAAPALAPPKNDDDDEGGSYALTDVTANPDLEEEEKKAAAAKKAAEKNQPKVQRKKLIKTKIQFAEEWQVVKFPFTLFMLGCALWGVNWLVQNTILGLAARAEINYNKLVEGVLLRNIHADDEETGTKGKATKDYEVGEHDPQSRVLFAIGCVVGEDKVGFGRMLYILSSLLTLAQGAIWLMAYFVLLKAPNRFGSRGQVLGLISLGIANLAIGAGFKLLPLIGVHQFAPLTFVVPEWAISAPNVERTIALPVFWSDAPFWTFFFGLLFTLLQYAEPALFCIYVYHLGLSIQNDRLRDKALSLTQVLLGMSYMIFAYHCMTIAGTTEVMIMFMKAITILHRAFLAWFLSWTSMILTKAQKDVVAVLSDEEPKEEGDEDEEDDEDEEEEDEEEEDEEEEDEEEEEEEPPRRRRRR